MGNLIKETPYSEITATLEILERFGVGREHLTALRKAASAKQMEVANTFISLLDDSSEGDGRSNLNIFKVTVDYSQSLAEMISAGNYGWVNSNIIEKYFPIKRSGRKEFVVELIHYNKTMTSEQVLADFKERGLKPAPLEVGLALGIEKPNLQREFPIVLLGSGWRSWDGRRFVPCLSGWGNDGRGLGLGCFESDWSEFYRFLAVRESMLADRQRSVGK